jgi:hypothetical protein
MTGILRLIIMSVIAYVVYAVIRRFLHPLMGAASRKNSTPQQNTYSKKDGAIDADYEEID